jgi:hypothetical protein
MTSRRFPAPWTVEQIPGGFKVLDASGQALVYVNGLSTVLTKVTVVTPLIIWPRIRGLRSAGA